MNELKHTPGPWVFHELETGFTVSGPNGYHVAEVINSNLHPDNLQNAHLITAAPALLSAARKALKLLETIAPHHPEPALLAAAIAQAVPSHSREQS